METYLLVELVHVILRILWNLKYTKLERCYSARQSLTLWHPFLTLYLFVYNLNTTISVVC